jgi:hypothetical protein
LELVLHTHTTSFKKQMKKVAKNPNIVLLNVTSQHLDKLHSTHEVHTKLDEKL